MDEKHEMAVMGSVGDLKVMWSRTNEDEVGAARAQFRDLKAKGYVAFQSNKDGSQGTQIDKFDPNIERMILVPPMVGG